VRRERRERIGRRGGINLKEQAPSKIHQHKIPSVTKGEKKGAYNETFSIVGLTPQTIAESLSRQMTSVGINDQLEPSTMTASS
jgi:hypothetical protein